MWFLFSCLLTASFALEMAGKKQPELNRFDSFAPVWKDCGAKWFVDGRDYMSAVADALEAASKEIFITDWQISPHIFMKRPDAGVDSLQWRLDKMLLRKADQGVRVYVLLYWESEKIAKMNLGSEFAQEVLKHENIEVLRHPGWNTWVGNLRWSHHEKIVVVDRSVAFVGGIDLCFGRWDTHNHPLVDNYPCHPRAVSENEPSYVADSTTYCRWVGKDYGNTFEGGGRNNVDCPFDDYIDRSTVPRMPWHDVACSFTGPPVKDVSKHFMQRYKLIRGYDLEEWQPSVSYTIPDPNGENLSVQVLRSVDNWSTKQPHEASICNAYIHAIANAQHVIYMENQFFISSQSGTLRSVENKILAAMADRILRAYRNNEDFHIYVVMPLKPEFPGEWDSSSGKDLRAVTYWNNLSLYNGEDSLYSRLEKGDIPKEKIHRYFSVYGLRTHDTLNSKLVTEIIYVHSKLMIVDDKVTIIGSANINDRSMLGSRDSEVAVIIEDTRLIEGRMNGQPFQVGEFSHGLRCHLIREHLGLLQGESYMLSSMKVEDPLALQEDFWKIAVENTIIYERVFGGRIIPSDHVLNYEDLKQRELIKGFADTDITEANEQLSEIHGSIVRYPTMFLKDVLTAPWLDVFGVYVDARGTTFNLETPQTMMC